MIHTKDQVINNILYGIAFGYNSCCIKYFNVRQVNGELFQQRERKLTGTGFICCNECNEKYSEQELTQQINKNRLVSTKFSPIADTNVSNEIMDKVCSTSSTLVLVKETIDEVNQYITLQG